MFSVVSVCHSVDGGCPHPYSRRPVQTYSLGDLSLAPAPRPVFTLADLYTWDPRKRSLGQGNIFRSVCQEFCPWGDLHLWGGRMRGCWGACMVAGGLCGCWGAFNGCGGHDKWLLGGMHGYRGACMVAGGCVVAGGHAGCKVVGGSWLPGVCVVAMHGCNAWLLGGCAMHGCWGVCTGGFVVAGGHVWLLTCMATWGACDE